MNANLNSPRIFPAVRRRRSFALKALPAAVAMLFSPPGWTVDITGGAGLPQNGTVSYGTATGSVLGNQLTIQADQRVVVNWGSFDINPGKMVQIIQSGTAPAMLNRVTGGASPSQILGSLSSNGTVMLMNPNGVMFGQNAVINVGSLIATTGNIDVANFIDTGGAQITGAVASITNHGSITAQNAGLVALVAPSVTNHGSITATGGTIALAGSTAATVSLNGGLYEFAIPGGATGLSVSNKANASLEGATLLLGVGDAANLLSGVINLEGVQQATDAIVVNGHAVVLKSALDAPQVSGNANQVDVYSGARIQDAVDISKTGSAGAGGSVAIHGGTYTEQVTVNKANLTLTGMNGATINVQEGKTGIDITANGVTVDGMQITGPYSQNFAAIDWTGLNTTGVKVASGVTGAIVRNNTIKNIRSGIQVTNATADITGNTIENTKGAILVRSNNVTMSGNSRGSLGNEWDIVFLDGVANGSYFVSPHVSEAQYGAGVMAMSAANGNMHILDRRYGVNGLLGATPQFGNRSHVTVSSGANFTAADDFDLGNGLGNDRQPLGTIQGGVDAVVTGGTVNVEAGTYMGAVNITKSLTLDGAGIGQTIVKAPSAASGDAVAIRASGVTLSDLSINDSYYGVHLRGTANNVTIDRVAFNNNQYSVRSGTDVKADNFRMLNSIITGGVIGVNILNGYDGTGAGKASFKNALFENVTVEGTDYKGFYFETADNLTMRNVAVTNAGNLGNPDSGSTSFHQSGAGIDINLKFDDFTSLNFDNVVVKNSGYSSNTGTGVAMVVKTRGVSGDSLDYTRAPASLQSVNIVGGSIEDSVAGLRVETLSNGSGGQPTVTISGTRFKNNAAGKDIVVDNTSVDARGAIFDGAADGFAIEDRVTHALDTTGRGLVTWTEGNVYVTQTSGSIQRGVDAVVAGGTVNVGSGTHVQDRTVTVDRSMTLAGTGEGTTVIDSRVVSNYGINVTADNVSLKDFTLYGPSANAAGSYGIKVAPVGDESARLRNFSISNVTSRGAGRAELDLNGVDGALIDRVTADGAPVGNNSGTTKGAGIQLTDSANVTVSNSTTRNNAWGGLAIYQANRHYNQQVNNVTIAGNNSFTERNPVYMQNESTSHNFGALTIEGFDFAARNASTADNSHQYTWLQASQQNALDYAVNLGNADSSYVQGWDRTQLTQDFHVGTGNLVGGGGTRALSIGTAMGNAATGANIRVGSGTYAEDVVVNNPYNLYFGGSTLRGLTLNAGAGGSGISGNVTVDGAGGILFNAPVNLLGDTTLATQGANITLNGDVQNAGSVARALRLVAGSGSIRGNVHMVRGGTETNALGRFEVVANDFSLDSTLWVKGYGVEALGNVALSNHTLRGQDATQSNTLNAGGDVSGSTITLGAVQVTSGGDVSANVTASEVAVAAVGDISGTTTSQGNVQISSSTGDISGNITGNNVVVQAQGDVSGTTSSRGNVQISSSTGDVSGNITGNNVVVQAQGDVNVVVTASNSASLAGDTVVANVVAPVMAVAAVTEVQISGSSAQVTVDSPRGSVSGSFGQVTNTGGGLVNVNGKPQGNQTLSNISENNRVIPTHINLANNAVGNLPIVRPALAGPTGGSLNSSAPGKAGEAIDSGQTVELDMSPGNEKE